jgi:hypothetical protein
VAKLVPDEAVLVKAYRRAAAIASSERAMNDALDNRQDDDVTIPPDLVDVVRARIAGTELSWDEVIWRLASGAAARRRST